MSKTEFKPVFELGEENPFGQFFIGQSYLKMLCMEGVGVANVTFEPRCRNNWHIHHATSGGGQILLCTDGKGWYQEWGKPARELNPGDVVIIPPEVKHWHGAAKDSWFTHLAIEVPGEETSNEWCEPVDNDAYGDLQTWRDADEKRIVPVIVTLLLALGLTACGESSSDTKEEAQNVAVNQNENDTSADTDTTEPLEADKVLIVYYSNTGTTESAAEQIAALTGGTLSKIERAEEYGDLEAEAEAEIQEGEQPEIITDIENLEAYDTIFVGYPIWWDEAPAMISTFLANNDFAGKTIIPFCTSASDDIGNSLHIFEELCPDAVIADGLTVNDATDIEPWLQDLGIL